MNDKTISPNRQKKEKIVAELLEKVNRAKGLVFTNYQGLTHKQLENLKKKVRVLDADLVVTKNTLLKLSLSGNQTFNSQLSTFKMPLQLFSYTQIQPDPLKKLQNQ